MSKNLNTTNTNRMQYAKHTDEDLPFDDDTIIMFGDNKGETLVDVKPSWLLWCEKTLSKNKYQRLHAYITENYDAIVMENNETQFKEY